jgi:hypothetical protein
MKFVQSIRLLVLVIPARREKKNAALREHRERIYYYAAPQQLRPFKYARRTGGWLVDGRRKVHHTERKRCVLNERG